MTTDCNQKRTDTNRYRVTLDIDVILPAEFVARNVPVLYIGKKLELFVG